MIVSSANAAPDAAELADPKAARAWAAAQTFEAMALGQLLAPMFATVDPSTGVTGGGEGEAAWRPMLTDEMAHALSRAGGLGLAAPVYRQMLRMQEAK